MKKQKWLLFNEEDFVMVIPNFDSKPHSIVEGRKKKSHDVAFFNCPCNPKIDLSGKPYIIHNSFIDQERIDKSPLSTLIVTNSIQVPKERTPKKLKILSVAPLLAEAIKRIHLDDSVSQMFA